MPPMTTSDRFPVVDITHKPLRTQAGNLERSMSLTKEEGNEETVSPTTSVPNTITIERAIEFYESHSEGAYKVLYSLTAKWLREFMTKSNPPRLSSAESPEEFRKVIEKINDAISDKEGNCE